MSGVNTSGLRSAALLATLMLFAFIALSFLQQGSRARSEANLKAELDRQLLVVLADLDYDNDPASDVASVVDERLGTDSPVLIYRARRNQEPAGIAITSVAPDGYSGDIQLLVGVDVEGKILGTRVLEHRETPGIGDRIERRRSDWITSLDQRTLNEPAIDRWHTRKPAGAFDAITGATITSEAVLASTRRVLQWFAENQNQVFAMTGDINSSIIHPRSEIIE